MNRKPTTVQDPSPDEPPAARDRRSQRTRWALTRALAELAARKRYDRLTVQELLDHANLGRSTFYAHYRSKDDLLLSSFRHLLLHLDGLAGAPGPENPRLAAVAELFEHVGASRAFHESLVRARMLDRLYQVGASTLALAIERRLVARRPGADPLTLTVQAQATAAALFGLLRWWLEQPQPPSPAEMDRRFHALWAEPVPRAAR